jgi:hypothetical protein
VPAIDERVFPGVGSRNYWAADADASGSASHWFIATADGTTSLASDTTPLSVRCVRGTAAACLPQCTALDCGPDGCGGDCGYCSTGDRCALTQACLPAGANSVIPPTGERDELLTVVISEGAVFDNATGRIWQREASAALSDWSTANAYCQGLLLEALSGWRLPSARELIDIVDYSRRDPALDGSTFRGGASRNFWAYDADASGGGGHWYMSAADGTTGLASNSSALAVRCLHD